MAAAIGAASGAKEKARLGENRHRLSCCARTGVSEIRCAASRWRCGMVRAPKVLLVDMKDTRRKAK